MNIIIIILIFSLFISYYRLSSGGHWFYFIGISVILRLLIPIPLVMDYAAYYSNHIYDYDFHGIMDIIVEPILKLVYNVSFFFLNDKKQTVHFIYWLNFSGCTFLFYRISKYQLHLFKKMLLFSFFYFIFTYVLLRNGIPYLLVFIFFYELNNTRGRLGKLVLASFFHASAALVLLVRSVFEIKLERLIFFGLIVMTIVIGFAFNNIFIFDYFTDKFLAYSEGANLRSIFHVIWMFFIFGVFIWSFIENVIQSSTLFFITLMIVYVILNYFNPVMGYRLSLYVMLFYLTLPIKNQKIVKYVPDLDLLSLSLFLLFYFNYATTHY